MGKELTNVELLERLAALPGSFIGDGCSYASIPPWMQKDHHGDCLHFYQKCRSQQAAVDQPEFQEALEQIKAGFSLLSTAKARAIQRIINEERREEHTQTVNCEVKPLCHKNADLREALEGLLGAVQGGDIETAKQVAYNALAKE